jgi:hypothetical protein
MDLRSICGLVVACFMGANMNLFSLGAQPREKRLLLNDY